ncbi:hypothetical protein BJ322DRAFT_1016659 [Thelephora terrestris]|uniref:Uncharacterized protein n=1 Tax=Thelephora terrestris TaxID=56493 RepID=A0A9P6HWT3_9AGAM|nr:hypothetical protein BJ322DRAFT_1016659 [Thelephora terrestris]
MPLFQARRKWLWKSAECGLEETKGNDRQGSTMEGADAEQKIRTVLAASSIGPALKIKTMRKSFFKLDSIIVELRLPNSQITLQLRGEATTEPLKETKRFVRGLRDAVTMQMLVIAEAPKALPGGTLDDYETCVGAQLFSAKASHQAKTDQTLDIMRDHDGIVIPLENQRAI